METRTRVSSVGDAQVHIVQVLQVDGARVKDDVVFFVLLQLRGVEACRDTDRVETGSPQPGRASDAQVFKPANGARIFLLRRIIEKRC